jgi:hypothetical protein
VPGDAEAVNGPRLRDHRTVTEPTSAAAEV